MPRTKETRNFAGTILEKQKTINGKRVTVFIARKRYPVTDADGNFVLNARGKKTYKDRTEQHLSKSAAQIALGNLPAKIKANKEKQRVETKTAHTFFALCDYFKREYCKPAVIVGNRQISGYRQNPKAIETYLIEYQEFFGDVNLLDLTYENIRAFAVYLATTPTRKENSTKLPEVSTVNRKLAYLRRLLNVGVRLRRLPVNPFKEGETLIHPHAENQRSRILTFEEETLFFRHFETDKITIKTERQGKPLVMDFDNPHRHLKLIVILAIDTGMRESEILSLQKEEIDLDAKIISLPAVKTKALKARFIPISDRLENELRAHFGKHNFSDEDFIFFGQKSCKKSFETMCDYLDIKDLTFHDLRHTATTWMDEAGITSAAKQNIIGHSSDKIHARYHNQSVNTFDAVRQKMNDFQRTRQQAEENKKAA